MNVLKIQEVHPQKFHHYLIASLYQYNVPEIMDSLNCGKELHKGHHCM